MFAVARDAALLGLIYLFALLLYGFLLVTAYAAARELLHKLSSQNVKNDHAS